MVAAVAEEKISIFEPSFASHVASFDLLLQLDSVVKPGITEEEFEQLFARCRVCRHYMTRRMTTFHECKAMGRVNLADVIDLTEEI